MSRRSESVAPSLFPFLAVLLCTMGALVLMLLLLVVGAQSSAKEVAEKVEDELEWQQDQLQTVKNSLAKKYEEAKLEIEKKRLHLQNVEQHIHELKEELEHLDRTAKSADQKQDTQQETQKQRDAQREALEKQLAEAKKTLESKVKDPKGDKPIFAIIPYEGPNGTHRRPIYLECNAKGLVVQPEGVVLTPADLSPPYGPGNPLDAVLRTIRAEFPSRDGSLDSNPYPLLVVRPSGIKHYMMARAAMSGWDDQFGYELISEELELSFPASAPNLQKKIASTIDTARQRQAALVLSMPQHYDASQLDFYGSGGGSTEDVSGEFEGYSANGQGSGQSGSVAQGSSGRRGGMSMLGGMNQGRMSAGTNAAGNSSDPPSLQQSLAQSQSNKNGPEWTFGQSAANASANTGNPGNGLSRDVAASGANGSNSSGQMSFFGGGSSDDSLGLTGRGSGSSSRMGGMGGGGVIGGDSVTADGDYSDSSAASSKATGGNSATAANDPSASGNTSLWNAAQAKASGATSSSSAGGSASGGSAAMNSNPMAGSPMSGSNLPTGATGDPSQIPGEIQNVGMNYDLNRRSQDTKPIAQSKGRGWAWRDGNRSQTAIVRAIWLQCYKDRWIVRPDKGSNDSATTIKLDGTPMQRAERLAASVHQRVEGWGVALAGGHWAPVIHVEVAADAEDQFRQLQKLMEGSGIEVIRKGTISPQVFR